MTVNKIVLGDCIEGLKELPAESVNMCVTSPPYWALRDYGIKGQYGLEETPEIFIQKLVQVFREVKRVLKDDGTLWLNIGDSYASQAKSRSDEQAIKRSTLKGSTSGQIACKDQRNKLVGDLKPKDLVGIPWMLAFALRMDGWYLRQDIIWHKPNPMPESVSDRCTKSHEYIFLLSKSSRYYYDAMAIATPYADKTLTTFGIETIKGNGDGSGLIQSENWSNSISVRKPKVWKTPDGWDTGKGSHGSFHKDGREKGRIPRPGIDTKGDNQGVGTIPLGINGSKLKGHSGYFDGDGNLIGNGLANKKSVWTVATKPFKEAHFATFPQELIVDCIKAGCPVDGIVLDPFMGAGTTALVASKLNRKYIGFELNPDYVAIAESRLKNQLGLFY